MERCSPARHRAAAVAARLERGRRVGREPLGGASHVWLRLLVAAALRSLTATPSQPPRNVLFLLDEFAVLGRMEVVEDAIA